MGDAAGDDDVAPSTGDARGALTEGDEQSALPDAEGPLEVVLPRAGGCAGGSCAASALASSALRYRPQCRRLFSSHFRREWLADSFASAIEDGSESALRAVLREELPGRVYSFEMLSVEFCDLLLADCRRTRRRVCPSRGRTR